MWIFPIKIDSADQPGAWSEIEENSLFLLQERQSTPLTVKSLAARLLGTSPYSTSPTAGASGGRGSAPLSAKDVAFRISSGDDSQFRFRILLRHRSCKFVVSVANTLEAIRVDWTWIEQVPFRKVSEVMMISTSPIDGTSPTASFPGPATGAAPTSAEVMSMPGPGTSAAFATAALAASGLEIPTASPGLASRSVSGRFRDTPPSPFRTSDDAHAPPTSSSLSFQLLADAAGPSTPGSGPPSHTSLPVPECPTSGGSPPGGGPSVGGQPEPDCSSHHHHHQQQQQQQQPAPPTPATIAANRPLTKKLSSTESPSCSLPGSPSLPLMADTGDDSLDLAAGGDPRDADDTQTFRPHTRFHLGPDPSASLSTASTSASASSSVGALAAGGHPSHHHSAPGVGQCAPCGSTFHTPTCPACVPTPGPGQRPAGPSGNKAIQSVVSPPISAMPSSSLSPPTPPPSAGPAWARRRSSLDLTELLTSLPAEDALGAGRIAGHRQSTAPLPVRGHAAAMAATTAAEQQQQRELFYAFVPSPPSSRSSLSEALLRDASPAGGAPPPPSDRRSSLGLSHMPPPGSSDAPPPSQVASTTPRPGSVSTAADAGPMPFPGFNEHIDLWLLKLFTTKAHGDESDESLIHELTANMGVETAEARATGRSAAVAPPEPEPGDLQRPSHHPAPALAAAGHDLFASPQDLAYEAPGSGGAAGGPSRGSSGGVPLRAESSGGSARQSELDTPPSSYIPTPSLLRANSGPSGGMARPFSAIYPSTGVGLHAGGASLHGSPYVDGSANGGVGPGGLLRPLSLHQDAFFRPSREPDSPSSIGSSDLGLSPPGSATGDRLPPSLIHRHGSFDLGQGELRLSASGPLLPVTGAGSPTYPVALPAHLLGPGGRPLSASFRSPGPGLSPLAAATGLVPHHRSNSLGTLAPGAGSLGPPGRAYSPTALIPGGMAGPGALAGDQSSDSVALGPAPVPVSAPAPAVTLQLPKAFQQAFSCHPTTLVLDILDAEFRSAPATLVLTPECVMLMNEAGATERVYFISVESVFLTSEGRQICLFRGTPVLFSLVPTGSGGTSASGGSIDAARLVEHLRLLCDIAARRLSRGTEADYSNPVERFLTGDHGLDVPHMAAPRRNILPHVMATASSPVALFRPDSTADGRLLSPHVAPPTVTGMGFDQLNASNGAAGYEIAAPGDMLLLGPGGGPGGYGYSPSTLMGAGSDLAVDRLLQSADFDHHPTDLGLGPPPHMADLASSAHAHASPLHAPHSEILSPKGFSFEQLKLVTTCQLQRSLFRLPPEEQLFSHRRASLLIPEDNHFLYGHIFLWSRFLTFISDEITSFGKPSGSWSDIAFKAPITIYTRTKNKLIQIRDPRGGNELQDSLLLHLRSVCYPYSSSMAQMAAQRSTNGTPASSMPPPGGVPSGVAAAWHSPSHLAAAYGGPGGGGPASSPTLADPFLYLPRAGGLPSPDVSFHPLGLLPTITAAGTVSTKTLNDYFPPDSTSGLEPSESELEASNQRWEAIMKGTHLGSGCLYRSLSLVSDCCIHGIPSHLRPTIWMRLSGSWIDRPSDEYYLNLLEGNRNKHTPTLDEIEMDLHRSLPEHPAFQSDVGISSLRRVLTAYSWRNPSLGYCQSMNIIASVLLLQLPEPGASGALAPPPPFSPSFPLPSHRILPSYYTKSMIGAVVDQHVFRYLVFRELPCLFRHLDQRGVDLNLLSVPWFVCLYLNAVPLASALRVMDMFFLEGPRFLFVFGLAVLKHNQKRIIALQDDDEIIHLLKDFFSGLRDDAQQKTLTTILADATSKQFRSITYDIINKLRGKYRLEVACKIESTSRKSQLRTIETAGVAPSLSFGDMGAIYDLVKRVKFEHNTLESRHISERYGT
ncbi:hypothetical protein H696_00389 [Fonticula alba]|uniref:Rab-GAP TBC domain-containing protein n=1 Tax=Fonticula alba TaxID=691883 RepID=A0A058ZFT0_FONAL|nr:hypothetical protein H696_00389 [Fonticula alba]KCV72811.1 hypothetical protein H696_00389 [Fonticula alba]|eukprot:XP_009492512.1 hypothetical protein H696_00389 [Fonticula alba]